MLSANSDSFISFLQIWMSFVFFFPCLITVGRTSSATLNKSGKSGHLSLVPYFRGKAFSFSPFGMMLAVGFSYMAFIMLRNVSLNPLFESFYYEQILNFVK